MKHVIASAICFFAIVSVQASNIDEDKVEVNFANCTAAIDGEGVELNFFEEFNINKGEATGHGTLMQIFRINNEVIHRFLSRIDVSDKGDKKVVKMYAVIDPKSEFSTFEIDTKKNSKIEVFAKNFNRVWGTISCTPVENP